jgi:hypothetical protein
LAHAGGLTALIRLLFEEAFDFRGRQFLPAALGQAFELQPANTDARETLNLVAEGVKHEANLALQALLEHDVRVIGPVHPGTLSACITFLGHHAFDELRHDLGGQRLVNGDLVFLFRALAGVNEPVREVTTVREENEAFTFFVQTADVMQGLELQWQKVVDRHPLMRVATRAEVAFGLVQGDDEGQFGPNWGTIDDHLVVGLHLRGQLLDDVPVDRDTSFQNDLFGPASRGDATLAQVSVQSHGKALFRLGLRQVRRETAFFP